MPGLGDAVEERRGVERRMTPENPERAAGGVPGAAPTKCLWSDGEPK
jgi:hypothetical protein